MNTGINCASPVLFLSRLAIGIVCLFAGGASAEPALQVDQTFIPPAEGIYYSTAVSSNQTIGQTFTVYTAGSLERVDLVMTRRETAVAPLSFEIRKVSSGVPDMSSQGLLYSSLLDHSAIPASLWAADFTISFSLGAGAIPVNMGDRLSIVCASAGDWYLWQNWQGSDLYANGSMAWRPSTRSYFTVLSDRDAAFRTWVAVPEPSSALLLLSGLLCLTLRGRNNEIREP